MRPAWLHDWRLTPREARELQEHVRRRVILRDHPALSVLPRRVAAVDVGYDRPTNQCGAALVVWDTERGNVIEQSGRVAESTFPYVPGLLSFREIPALIPLFEALKVRPKLIICDGQGYAHPRRVGLASHLGVVLDCPTIGWAKSRLIGEHEEPATERGTATALMDGEEQIGWVLRSRAGVRPTFLSPGHRVSMETTLRLARELLGPYRLCEPARAAHRLTRELLGKG